jgi:hypothetical protein
MKIDTYDIIPTVPTRDVHGRTHFGRAQREISARLPCGEAIFTQSGLPEREASKRPMDVRKYFEQQRLALTHTMHFFSAEITDIANGVNSESLKRLETWCSHL